MTVVTNGGGRTPLWRGDGKEIFYLGQDGLVTAVEVDTGAGFRAGAPKSLFKAPAGVAFWDVAADGLSVVFHLRPGLQWSDGQPLTADDVIWTYSTTLAITTTTSTLQYHLRDTVLQIQKVDPLDTNTSIVRKGLTTKCHQYPMTLPRYATIGPVDTEASDHCPVTVVVNL